MATERLLELRRLAELRGVDVPRETSKVDQIPDTPAPIEPDKPETLLDKAKGVGEAALTVGTGAAGVLPSVAASIGTAITGGDPLKRMKEFSQNTTYAPRTQAGQRYVGNVAHAIDESKLAGLNPAVGIEAAALSRPAMSAARQTAGKVPAAVAASPEGEMMSRAAGNAKLSMTPTVAPDRAALARKAQLLGIELRPDMLADNKFARLIGEALEQVPASGSKAEQRQAAFNRSLGNMIGADAKAQKLTPDVFDKAMTASGEKIGEIASKTTIPMDTQLRDTLAEFKDRAAKFETENAARIVGNYVDEIVKKSEGGELQGEAYRKLNSEIGRKARTTSDGDLKHALGDLQDIMHDALTKQLSGEDLAQLQQARKQYAIAKTIEPLVAKSKDGDISPASLMSAVTSDKAKKAAMARGKGGDLGELARIGQTFLKEPKSSGTAERNLAYGMIGDAGKILRDVAIYPAANAYNRLGPKISQKMTGVKQTDIDRAKLGYQP